MSLRFITKLLHTITLSKVILWAGAALLATVLFTVYENRKVIFDITTSAEPGINPIGIIFSIGPETRRKIENFVKAEEHVIGFSVLTADLRLNRRTSIFFYGFDDGKESPPQQPNSPFNRLPLFSSSEENNRQVVKLINGEFFCAPYSTSLLSITSPNLNPNARTLCRASLPPYYGNFVGFITVFLKNEPSVEEQVRLKSSIESMATEIYFRDVLNTSRRAKD